jgi:hypothetical protein
VKIIPNNKKSSPFKVFNGLRTPDGTLLVSSSLYDYQSYKDKNGKTYILDGGLEDYFRHSVNGDEIIISLFSNSPDEQLRQYLGRVGYGKDGTGEFRYTSLCDMSDNYLDNSIKYVKNQLILYPNNVMLSFTLNLYKREKSYRSKHKITIEDSLLV